MPEADAMDAPEVMEKVFSILKRELSAEEYLIYLQTITPKIGDSKKELRDITAKMRIEEILRRAKQIELSMSA